MADDTAAMMQFKPRQSLEQLFKDYEFFRRSYEGGSAYREGGYLIKHPREKNEDYARRLAQASFVNFCGDTCDIYTAYLYREQPERTTEEGKSDDALEAFVEDADLQGRAWSKVMRGISNMASYYGIMGAIVDKPKGVPGASRGAELAAGVRPYVAAYAPLAIWDWKFTKDTNGVKILSELILEEDNDGGPTQIMKWTLTSWELWEETPNTEKKFSKIDEGDNKLGRIPFAILKNRDSFKKMTGKSDISDIADVNKRIYFLDSDALEIIENCAIPVFEGPVEAIEDSSGKSQETVIATTTLLKRPEDKEGFKWIEAPHTSLEQILNHRNSSINDIKYMAKTGQGDDAKSGQVKSGVALELEFQQLSALMVDKAENAEDFEGRVFELVGLWEETDYEMTIQYPRSFGIRDLMHDLDTAITSKMVITSPTFQAELAKGFAARLLPRDTDPKIMEQIDKELENPAPLPGSEEDGEDGDTP